MRKLAPTAMCLAFLLSFPIHARSAELSANELRTRCQLVRDMAGKKDLTPHEMMLAVTCVSRLQGFFFGWNVHAIYAEKQGLKQFMICFPRDLDGEESMVQMASIIVKYVDDNPTESHEPWDVIFMRAFQQYYPCDR